MPTVAQILARLLWVAVMLLCLLSSEECGVRCKWWQRYLSANLLFAPLYWPELPGWYEVMWPWVAVILGLRMLAGLEALHFQTRDFPMWSSMMAMVFLIATAITCLVWRLHHGESWEMVIQLRRYGQIWIASVMAVTPMFLWRVNWLRRRPEDEHSALVAFLCLTHGVLSVLSLTGPHSDDYWRNADIAATLADSAAYAAWYWAAGNWQRVRNRASASQVH